MFARRFTPVAMAVAFAGLVSCSTGEEATVPTTQPESPSTLAQPSTSTSAPTTNVPTTPPTTAVACLPVAPLPPQESETSIPADLDGDGSLDTVRVYRLGSEWHLRAEIDGQGVHDQAMGTTERFPVGMKAAGATPLNPSDATEEVWVRVDSGAYTDIYGLFVFRDCRLDQVGGDGGRGGFARGSSAKNSVGFACWPHGIETTSSHRDDEGNVVDRQTSRFVLDVTSQPSPTLRPVENWPDPSSEDQDAPGDCGFDR